MSTALRSWMAIALSLLISACASSDSLNERRELIRAEIDKGIAAATQAGFKDGVYEGAWQNGQPEGDGIYRFHDGRRYEGAFRMGRMDGTGKMSYPDGRRVEGVFRNGVEADVTLTYADGRIFEGAVRNAIPEGPGLMRFADGGKVTGRFKSGAAEGRALYSKPDGSAYFGPFNHGVPSGTGYCISQGASSVCSRNGDTDTTADELNKLLAKRNGQAVADAVKAERAALDREFATQMAAVEKDRSELKNRRARQAGPTSEHDLTCYCTLTGGCLSVGSGPDRVPAEVRRLQEERQLLACRDTYADWLQIKKLPDYAKRMAELDRTLQNTEQRLDREAVQLRRKKEESEAALLTKRNRDASERSRLLNTALAQEQQQRQKHVEDTKGQCRNAQVRRLNPCKCSAVLNEPLPKGGACEA